MPKLLGKPKVNKIEDENNYNCVIKSFIIAKQMINSLCKKTPNSALFLFFAKDYRKSIVFLLTINKKNILQN
jgi:hypothetical protein